MGARGDALGLVGFSLGGLLAPRAAAFEHRVAAVMALDGVYDFGQSLLDSLPARLVDVFQSGDAALFDAVVARAVADPSMPAALRWAVQQGLWAFNVRSPFAWVSRAAAYSLAGLTQAITAPVLVADAEGDQFFAGQARLLADQLGAQATYHRFRAVDGAGEPERQHALVGVYVDLRGLSYERPQPIHLASKTDRSVRLASSIRAGLNVGPRAIDVGAKALARQRVQYCSRCNSTSQEALPRTLPDATASTPRAHHRGQMRQHAR